MDSKEKNIREHEADNSDLIANSLRVNGRERKRESTRRVNKLWLWLGVLVLIAILLYWLFSIGIMEDIAGVFNG